jgi:NAD(P)-dependent dehydrogenase (short-subunit alcohol dehydrogenase family)
VTKKMKQELDFVVITGGSRGIGSACASLFSHMGYGIILVGRDKKRLEIVAHDLETEALVVSTDINESASDSLIKKACGTNSIAGLINNAGIFHRAKFRETDSEIWREQFQTNLFSPVRLTKSLIPLLEKHQKPSILNVASTVGVHPVAGMSAYSATKAAVVNWTKVLALELAPLFRVNCVCPGIVDTPLHSFSKTQKKELANAQPLGRVGTPEEVAASVYFLFASPWTTGAILPVDGGISLT